MYLSKYKLLSYLWNSKIKMCHVSARRLSIYNFAWELLMAHKKVYLVPQNWKGANNSYEYFAKNLQAQPKILKNNWKTKSTEIPIKTKNFSKKLCFLPKKWKGARNLYESYPTKFAGPIQNPKKILGTSNQSIRTKIILKKVFLVP
jgi:hypothetical protein